MEIYACSIPSLGFRLFLNLYNLLLFLEVNSDTYSSQYNFACDIPITDTSAPETMQAPLNYLLLDIYCVVSIHHSLLGCF